GISALVLVVRFGERPVNQPAGHVGVRGGVHDQPGQGRPADAGGRAADDPVGRRVVHARVAVDHDPRVGLADVDGSGAGGCPVVGVAVERPADVVVAGVHVGAAEVQQGGQVLARGAGGRPGQPVGVGVVRPGVRVDRDRGVGLVDDDGGAGGVAQVVAVAGE